MGVQTQSPVQTDELWVPVQKLTLLMPTVTIFEFWNYKYGILRDVHWTDVMKLLVVFSLIYLSIHPDMTMLVMNMNIVLFMPTEII